MNETISAYEAEPYRRSLETEVIEIVTDGVVLKDTVLFPEGGGQPSDHGALETPDGIEAEVVSVRRSDGVVVHRALDGSLDWSQVVEPEQTVGVSLDWDRRYDHMQQHTAQHLLSALAEDRFGWRTTSFHLGEERSDVELDSASLSPSSLAELEEQVNEKIRQGLGVRSRRLSQQEFFQVAESEPVRSRGLPAEHVGSVRLVEIDGVDLNTCGGTHVVSTAELQVIKLLDSEPMRGGTRLHWLAGNRVLRQFAKRESLLGELRRVFETGDHDLLEIAQQRLAAGDESRKRARAQERELVELWIDKLADRAGSRSLIEAHFEGREMGFLASIGKGLLELSGGDSQLALLTGSSHDRCSFVLVRLDDRLQLEEIGREVLAEVGGRGGGRAPFFQGVADSWSTRDALVAKLNQRLAASIEE